VADGSDVHVFCSPEKDCLAPVASRLLSWARHACVHRILGDCTPMVQWVRQEGTSAPGQVSTRG